MRTSIRTTFTGVVLLLALRANAQTSVAEGTRLSVPNAALPVDVLVEAPSGAPGELQVICLFASTPENKLQASLAVMDARLNGTLTKLRSQNLFRGTLGETMLITPKPGTIAAKRLLLIGLGDRDAFTPTQEEFIGEVVYAESERLHASTPTFAPTILDGGKTGIDTGVVGAEFLKGFLRARAVQQVLHDTGMADAPQVTKLTFLAGTAHALDTQRGLAGVVR